MRPAIAYIHQDHLLHNYQLLRQRAGSAELMAVVKANAYGHGLEHIAPILSEHGCQYFAVTDAAEGVQLRALVQQADITLLSGLFEPSDAQLCQQYHLTPVITQKTHLQWLQDAQFQGQVWIKVDTGMQRLGAQEPDALYQQALQHNIQVAGIMSHLACADTPEHPLNQAQADAFQQLHQSFSPAIKASLLNSAGMVAFPQQSHDMVRPGIALYGSEPIAHEPIGLKPVMQLTAKVMQIRQVQKGTTLSYGATHTAAHDMKVALICLGYADGLPRSLSNCGMAEFQGQALPIVGRVCMDYCLLDCSKAALQVGDTVIFWGSEHIAAHTVAQQTDTIPYTLMTGIGARVQRVTIKGESF